MGFPTIQIDTRQKDSKHEAKHGRFRELGIHCVRTKLYVGDYMFVGGTRSVDTKRDIQELASDIFNQHARFRRELENARDAGIDLTVLVENSDGVRSLGDLMEWIEPANSFARRHNAQRRIEGLRLAKACATMSERYGARWAFCAPEDAGDAVLSILAGEEVAYG